MQKNISEKKCRNMSQKMVFEIKRHFLSLRSRIGWLSSWWGEAINSVILIINCLLFAVSEKEYLGKLTLFVLRLRVLVHVDDLRESEFGKEIVSYIFLGYQKMSRFRNRISCGGNKTWTWGKLDGSNRSPILPHTSAMLYYYLVQAIKS